MSTLPGQASKGEKTKSKFQSLDINSLYNRVSRGENLEKQQQKSSSVYIKHGMQSLGKVPNARRAPANLPSLKAEHSGSDAAVPLVPPGAQGWGKQDANSPSSTPPSNAQTQNSSTPASNPNQPATTPQLSSHQAAIALPVTNAIPHPHKQLTPSAQPAPIDKLWSSVMSGQDIPHPPIYQSPQFQHEFPSLSAGDGVPTRTGSDAPQYPSGLSLRPQTEGSWTQGGQRPAGPENAGQGRPSSGHQAAPPQLSAQGGQQHPFPPQMRGVMPSFMYKGSNFQQGPGNGVQNSQNAAAPSVNGRVNRNAEGRPPRLEADEAAPRPIIKEEELTRMDEIGKDMGWAESDEIDYNQKLAFSDDETDRGANKKEIKRHQKEESHVDAQQPRQWGGSRPNAPRSRPAEEEDIWAQRRNQTEKDVEIAVQRAKQRKEEEEKRFQEERKQAAAKKLMELEEKIQKRDRDSQEVPKPVDVPVPERQKDKEPVGPSDDKNVNTFRQLTQIEGKHFPARKHANAEQNAPNFSRNFQNDLPPRFRQNGSANPPNQYHQQQQQFDNRWAPNKRNAKPDNTETERDAAQKDYARQGSDDGYRGSHHAQQQDLPAKVQEDKDKERRQHAEDWSDRREKPREMKEKERPQRAARHSEPRDYMGAWSEPPYEHAAAAYEEKRRVVPGPITKERIELDDMRNEKRGLTQLKRGQPTETLAKKHEEAAAAEKKEQRQFVGAWADSIPPAIEEPPVEAPSKKADEGNRKPYGQKKGWGNDYHASRGQPWSGRRPPRRGGTDSDGSADDQKPDARNDTQKSESPKAARKSEKKESYVPRGEPSRHGRGGGTFRSGRTASISKKIDGYGPPPAKSPFGGHNEDKEKKPDTVPPAETAGGAEDKIKQNQQALAAGIIGKRTEPPGDDRNKAARPKPDTRKNKPTDGSDKPQAGNRPAVAPNRGRNAPPRANDKRYDPSAKHCVAGSAKEAEDKDEHRSSNGGDSEGFQEVKSKKTVKERQKSAEDKPKPDAPKPEQRKSKMSATTQQLTQQQIQNIPSLMATPVNPPPVLPQTKSGFDRGRQTSKLPPRLAKQKLHKQAMQQQQQHMCDLGDANKVGQNVYGSKDAAPSAPVCAWDKPLVQLRNVEHEGMLGVSVEVGKGMEQPVHSPSQLGSGGDKMLTKPNQLQDKPLLDGTTAPVNTIIFENTNLKSSKPRSKLEDAANMDMSGFNNPKMNELLQNKSDAAKTDAIQMPLFKEDTVDMKMDFFNADLQFADDKASKNFVSKSIHAITSGNNTVDSLDIKIASVKKVWETSEQEGEDNQMSFGAASLGANVFDQGKDNSEDGHDGYNQSPNQTAQTNVCKVKPTQQVSGGGQTTMSSGHQPHAGMVAAGLMGNPLSPPPIPPVLGAGVGMGPQYTANQHIGYQSGLSGSTQYGISAIPSPPTVPLVYNSSQQMQSAVQSAGLYGAFQLDQLSGQGRSQYSQYANYHGLGQTANSPYSTPSVYLPTPPHPPPPTAQAPPPELYQNMNNFRLSATTPFGQNQQLNNPTTVLISSTSNSLMSASVKPSGQQISAIGTKAGGVGQAYQQQSQQGQQVFMTYDPSIQANYLASNAGVMQRAPAQNNVVPGLQPSSSYYSGSTGGQTGFFQQPGNSSMASAQHQAGYGLQGNVFGTHSQSHTNSGLQNYNSHFLTTPMQMAAALNAQQFRSSLPAAAYMKGVGNQQMGDQSGRSQQLKSPGSQEALSSVFNSGPQIPSPKSRQNMKHPPQQSSPTSQHKFNMYQQGVGGPPNMNMQRYPTPIQRPINFQQMQQNTMNQKHRNNPNNKPSNNRYYSNQNHSLSGQSDKCDDAKMNDGGPMGTAGGGAKSAADKVKDNIKEEPVALKD